MPMSGRSKTMLLLVVSALSSAFDRAAAAPLPPEAPAPRAPHPIAEQGDAFPELPVRPGAWSENKQYRFRLDRIESCGAAPPAALKGETSWVGAFFTIEARQPKMFVSARDLELRRGGVILAATIVNPPALPGCRPLLASKRMKPGETIAGFALFEVPKSFRVRTDDPIVLFYRPTRWGGSRRAEVPIPECLDACVKPWVVAPSAPRRERGKR